MFLCIQKKTARHCDRCRLQFIHEKDEWKHRLKFHRTFVKPKQLEGLVPGTRVSLCYTSADSNNVETLTPHTCLSLLTYVSENRKCHRMCHRAQWHGPVASICQMPCQLNVNTTTDLFLIYHLFDSFIISMSVSGNHPSLCWQYWQQR